MALDEESQATQEDQAMVIPGSSTDPTDPVTYDPTQGRGTSAWERTRMMQAQLNQDLGINAHLRRN